MVFPGCNAGVLVTQTIIANEPPAKSKLRTPLRLEFLPEKHLSARFFSGRPGSADPPLPTREPIIDS